MPLFRLLGMLAVLGVLGACSQSSPPANVPQLPELELLETTEGAPYEVSLAATGGTPPLYHSLEKAPPGFSFYTGPGLLKGPASASGQYSFTVQVKDAAGATNTRTYRLLVYPAPIISTGVLPAATTGTQYGVQLEATAGKAPLSWTVSAGTLPAGLSLSEGGQLAGLPRESGTYAFTVRAQDVHGAQTTKALSLEVRAGTTDGGSTSDGGTPDSGTVDAGTTLSLGVANWNVEWFGDPSNGPTNDALQLDNVQAVIADAGMDIWGLEELVDATEFNALKQRLPGYDGFMANDSRVTSGASYYSTSEQKVGLLFRSDVVSVRSAQVILTEYGFEFAGRPPMRVDLRFTRNGTSVDLVAIVLHMKAMADRDSYDRRTSAGLLLKDYLDTYLPNERVIVLGDWNDDVDFSILWDSTTSSYLPSPYQNFVDDTANYSFVTRPLSLAKQRSTVSNTQFIDHQLVSNELLAGYVSNSTQVLKPTITQYGTTTSDHYPVLSRFDFGSGAPPPPPPLRLLSPNGGEQLSVSTVRTITWLANGVSNVKLEYSPDDGATWTLVASSVPAASGQYTWTVPPVATTQGRVRVSDVSAPSTSDMSDGVFTVTNLPPVFINEYLPHPNNLAGTTTPDYDQQFVELYNAGTDAVDLSGWQLNDDKSYSLAEPPRHIFPAGTRLEPGKAYVVYSGASALPAGATNADVANGTDSAGTPYGLRLNRGKNVGSTGDTVYLQRADGSIVDSHHYDNTYQGVSYNSSPDMTRMEPFVRHDTLPSGLVSSPGRRADGNAF